MKHSLLIFLIVFFIAFNINMNGQEDKRLIFDFENNGSIQELFEAWTTSEGIKSFFAPDANIELKSFGKFHIYFFPDAPEGQRGSENNVVLSFEENKMFSFTWDFPPSLLSLRDNQRTVVLIRFMKLDENRTRVLFIQSGWGNGEDWQKGYAYFKSAWGDAVLARLKYIFENKPIEWNNLPDYSGYKVKSKDDL